MMRKTVFVHYTSEANMRSEACKEGRADMHLRVSSCRHSSMRRSPRFVRVARLNIGVILKYTWKGLVSPHPLNELIVE